MPGDGDQFGELSLYDFNKIIVKDNKKHSDSAGNSQKEDKPDVKLRGGTCTAVEETFALKIDHQIAREIFQPKNNI